MSTRRLKTGLLVGLSLFLYLTLARVNLGRDVLSLATFLVSLGFVYAALTVDPFLDGGVRTSFTGVLRTYVRELLAATAACMGTGLLGIVWNPASGIFHTALFSTYATFAVWFTLVEYQVFVTTRVVCEQAEWNCPAGHEPVEDPSGPTPKVQGPVLLKALKRRKRSSHDTTSHG